MSQVRYGSRGCFEIIGMEGRMWKWNIFLVRVLMTKSCMSLSGLARVRVIVSRNMLMLRTLHLLFRATDKLQSDLVFHAF
jgi:hypothetical protein